MTSHKLNSIIQFLEFPNGRKITLVTNPLQMYADVRDKDQERFCVTYLSSCSQRTAALIELTRKIFPNYFPDIIYV